MRAKNHPPAGGFFCEVNMNDRTATIFVNGEMEKSEKILELVSSSELIVAVDGGLAHVGQLGLIPHIIIGDLDSVDKQDIPHYEELGVIIRQFPQEKDETDLELAIQYVIESGFNRILLLGATGGRIDHFLGNLYLCSNPRFKEIDIKIITNNSEMFFCKKNQEITGEPGDLISLIPISEQVCGVSTQGLKYPLVNEELTRWKSRGISNVMLDKNAEVNFQSGTLFCVHVIKKER
jgi:thiamine pyrophosphokinase